MEIKWYIDKFPRIEDTVNKLIVTMIEFKIDILDFEFEYDSEKFCISANTKFNNFEVTMYN